LRGRPGKVIEQMTCVNPEENIDREGLVHQLQMTFDEEDHSTTTKQTNLDPFPME